MGAHWPVTAIKSYIGHSQGTAGGDQLANALGTFATGWLPGIKTTQTLAEDVHNEGLTISYWKTARLHLKAFS